jgi:hypothetical protein
MRQRFLMVNHKSMPIPDTSNFGGKESTSVDITDLAARFLTCGDARPCLNDAELLTAEG